MPDKMDDAKIRYSYEINNVRNRLRLLEEGRIKELTGANMDGYLATNVNKLREELNDLFSKVINGSDSINDELGDFFK